MANKEITLRTGQQQALDRMKDFVGDSDHRVFILRGYAGTGKTTLIKQFIDHLSREHKLYHLLASTGRAAKILGNITGQATHTVHSLIYVFSDFNQDLDKIVDDLEQLKVDKSGQLLLIFEPLEKIHTNTIYIVDEASMIPDKKDLNATQALFGTGRLLSDLLGYDSGGKFIFVGDPCQLPPVCQPTSPALSATYIHDTFGLGVQEIELDEVIRQREGNDIVVAAQNMRQLYYHPLPSTVKWAKFPLRDCRNIHMVGSQTELKRLYVDNIQSNGYNNSTMITLSNRQCANITQYIRSDLGLSSTWLQEGDLLLVTQNNYISDLMNGDMVRVIKVGQKIEKRAGLTFLFVTVKELFSGRELSQLLIADILYDNLINLTQEQQKNLFIDFHIRMRRSGIRQGSDDYDRAMRKDDYLNALRAVYGFVLTCHKSQGGEWDKVFLDLPRNIGIMKRPYVYQWMYTAMTRAKEDLYVVNDFFFY